jgi:restriction endonuclease S subunit
LAAIRLLDEVVYRDLIIYFLRHSLSEIMERNGGSTFPNLPGQELRAFPFPLAPYSEQERMPNKLSEWMNETNRIERVVESSGKALD